MRRFSFISVRISKYGLRIEGHAETANRSTIEDATVPRLGGKRPYAPRSHRERRRQREQGTRPVKGTGRRGGGRDSRARTRARSPLTRDACRASLSAVADWDIDIATAFGGGDQAPSPAVRLRVVFVREVVEAATSRAWAREPWASTARCVGPVARRACGARVVVGLGETGLVRWRCPGCSEAGTISGVAGGLWDLSEYAPADRVRWGFEEPERKLLDAATAGEFELRAVIARASPEDGELLVVEAIVDELDLMYECVARLMDGTSSRRQIDLLEGLLCSLSSSIDDV
jgi:hypothetical protein